MSTICKYVVCNDPDEWGDEPMHDSAMEAHDQALSEGRCVVEVEFEYIDSGLAWDFRPVHMRAENGTDALCDGDLMKVRLTETEEDVTCPLCQDILDNRDPADRMVTCAHCGKKVREGDSWGEGDVGMDEIPSFCSEACYQAGPTTESED